MKNSRKRKRRRGRTPKLRPFTNLQRPRGSCTSERPAAALDDLYETAVAFGAAADGEDPVLLLSADVLRALLGEEPESIDADDDDRRMVFTEAARRQFERFEADGVRCVGSLRAVAEELLGYSPIELRQSFSQRRRSWKYYRHRQWRWPRKFAG